MNFLGHSLLAFGDQGLLVGQFAGDFVRGRHLDDWAPREAEGIRLHRFIDAFTDRHASIATLRRQFAPERRRFAGIALDVELDYRLAIGWQEYGLPLTGGSLEEHTLAVDAALSAARRPDWPPELEQLRKALVGKRLFARWSTREGVTATLQRLASRAPRLAPLADTPLDLEALGCELAAVLDSFWPELVATSRELAARGPVAERMFSPRPSGTLNSRTDEPVSMSEKGRDREPIRPEQLRRPDPVTTPLANREASFLAFDTRVLELARDARVPLLERLRFLCISSSNLDEFFEVRVAGIKQKILGGVEGAGVDGLSPAQELELVRGKAHTFVEQQYDAFNDELMPALADEGVRFLPRAEWDSNIKDWVRDYFQSDIAPVLSPLGLDPAHPFPRLTNKSLTFIIDLRGVDAFGRDSGYALVRAPRSLPRVIPIPADISGFAHGFVFLSSIIHSEIAELFSGMDPLGVYQFKVTRNSELYVQEEEVANLRRALESELMQRNFGEAVRLEVAANCPPRVIKYLQRQFRLDDGDVYRVNGPVNLNRLIGIPDEIDRPDLKFESFTPAIAPAFEPALDIFELIKQRGDIVFHHPYESYEPVIDLVRQAAADPDVLAIKQTLYRTGAKSLFVKALMEASLAGKDVTVVIELRARFDEEANIALATRLQEAGIQVVYGVVGFKTHAKMLLIVRREKKRLQKYVHVGTGNYHATTARLYTDISLMTASKALTDDVQKVFTQLTGLGRILHLKRIVQAPFALHDFVIARIRGEMEIAQQGGQGRIIARMNSLVDARVIEALYDASRAGVRIDLIVRGICMLRAQLPGISENIRVVSVLGRFLEHSRVFWFGADGDERVWISSADWMPRNFFSRVEIAVPLEGEAMRRVKEECLDFYVRDNSFAWELGADGDYRRVDDDGEAFSAQQALIDRYFNRYQPD